MTSFPYNSDEASSNSDDKEHKPISVIKYVTPIGPHRHSPSIFKIKRREAQCSTSTTTTQLYLIGEIPLLYSHLVYPVVGLVIQRLIVDFRYYSN